jgi:hypothetical protein
MKRTVNTKIFWLLFLLIAIIFATTTFGTFEGLEMPPMDTSSLTEEQKRILANAGIDQTNMPVSEEFLSR